MEEGIELQMYDLYKERKWEEVIQLSKEIEHPQAANYYLMSLTHTGGIEAVRDDLRRRRADESETEEEG